MTWETISSGKPSPPDEVLINILSCVTDAFCSLRLHKDLNDLKPSLACQIFDSMISPKLTYNNDVWGVLLNQILSPGTPLQLRKPMHLQLHCMI